MQTIVAKQINSYMAKRTSGILGWYETQRAVYVIFSTGAVYKYTYKSCGKLRIKTLKRLLRYGAGAQAYVNKKIRMLYAERIQ